MWFSFHDTLKEIGNTDLPKYTATCQVKQCECFSSGCILYAHATERFSRRLISIDDSWTLKTKGQHINKTPFSFNFIPTCSSILAFSYSIPPRRLGKSTSPHILLPLPRRNFMFFYFIYLFFNSLAKNFACVRARGCQRKILGRGSTRYARRG